MKRYLSGAFGFALAAGLCLPAPADAGPWERREFELSGQPVLLITEDSTNTVAYNGEEKKGSFTARCDGDVFSFSVMTRIEPSGSKQAIKYQFDRYEWDTTGKVPDTFWANYIWEKDTIVNLKPGELGREFFDGLKYANRFSIQFVAARDGKTYRYDFEMGGYTKALAELEKRCGASMPAK